MVNTTAQLHQMINTNEKSKLARNCLRNMFGNEWTYGAELLFGGNTSFIMKNSKMDEPAYIPLDPKDYPKLSFHERRKERRLVRKILKRKNARKAGAVP
mmetsp:Transcript_23300/g.56500  ORF Transcript_23300/g.56500 Transcript_23300/m.56500 type:complete len:99 (+) Transcript_23300:767-1063(+)